MVPTRAIGPRSLWHRMCSIQGHTARTYWRPVCPTDRYCFVDGTATDRVRQYTDVPARDRGDDRVRVTGPGQRECTDGG
jgi:hypothetical protein